MRGYLSAELRETDVIRVATSQWRREWEAKEVAKLVAAAEKEGRLVDPKRFEASVRARKLTAADCKQRDKQVVAALKEHNQIFGELKRKRQEEAARGLDDAAPERPKKRVSGEMGLLKENLRENAVLDGSEVSRGSKRCTRAVATRSRIL